MLINSGITIYQGSTPLVRVYQGGAIVWERQQPTGDIPLLYLANGADSTEGTTRDVFFTTGVAYNERIKIEIKVDVPYGDYVKHPILCEEAKSTMSLSIIKAITEWAEEKYGFNVILNTCVFEGSEIRTQVISNISSQEPIAPQVVSYWIDEGYLHLLNNDIEYTSEEIGWLDGYIGGSIDFFGNSKEFFRTNGGTKIYYLKIWDGGTLVRDYVPVLHNNIPCFRDNLSGTYIYNLGTDTPTYQIL